MLENALLGALPRNDQAALASQLEAVTLTFGDPLHVSGEAIRFVYFPEGALVSLLVTAAGHPALEVGLIGPEGMAGLSAALHAGLSPVEALVQGTGRAQRMAAPQFRVAVRRSQALQRGLFRYGEALLAQVSQTAACNRFHSIEQRLARWLLSSSDRMQQEHFHMTQAFLGHMLGVRRVGVTEAAQMLQRAQLIRYHRGDVDILDRSGLQQAACGCYALTKAIDDRLLQRAKDAHPEMP